VKFRLKAVAEKNKWNTTLHFFEKII
jgi:hypothetical protein